MLPIRIYTHVTNDTQASISHLQTDLVRLIRTFLQKLLAPAREGRFGIHPQGSIIR